MNSLLYSPKLLKGGIALIDPKDLTVQKIIALQYNPHTVTRTLQMQNAGGEGGEGDQSEALRRKGPAIETIKVEAEIDAADQLEIGHDVIEQYGIQPQLAALEMIVNPSAEELKRSQSLFEEGALEIFPQESLLTVFIWGGQRILPVIITEFSITEDAFDPSLNPLRAKVSLGMRVLNADDLGVAHIGSRLFMSSLERKEKLRDLFSNNRLSALGITMEDIT